MVLQYSFTFDLVVFLRFFFGPRQMPCFCLVWHFQSCIPWESHTSAWKVSVNFWGVEGGSRNHVKEIVESFQDCLAFDRRSEKNRCRLVDAVDAMKSPPVLPNAKRAQCAATRKTCCG